MGRILEPAIRRPYGMTLEVRPRQLRDEDKSCGTQPAHIRVIDRRLSLLMFCFTSYVQVSSLSGLREPVKGSPTKQTKDLQTIEYGEL